MLRSGWKLPYCLIVKPLTCVPSFLSVEYCRSISAPQNESRLTTFSIKLEKLLGLLAIDWQRSIVCTASGTIFQFRYQAASSELLSPQNKLSSLKLSCSLVVVEAAPVFTSTGAPEPVLAPKLLLVTGLPPEVSENPTEAGGKSVRCPRLAGFAAFESLMT